MSQLKKVAKLLFREARRLHDLVHGYGSDRTVPRNNNGPGTVVKHDVATLANDPEASSLQRTNSALEVDASNAAHYEARTST